MSFDGEAGCLAVDEGQPLLSRPRAGSASWRSCVTCPLRVALALAFVAGAIHTVTRDGSLLGSAVDFKGIAASAFTQLTLLTSSNDRDRFLQDLDSYTAGKPWRDICSIYTIVLSVYCGKPQGKFSTCPQRLQEFANTFNGSAFTQSDRSAIHTHMLIAAEQSHIAHCVDPSLCVRSIHSADQMSKSSSGTSEQNGSNSTNSTNSTAATNRKFARGRRLCAGNVTTLYHQTTMWACRRILATGFDLKYSKPGNLGRAIYFSHSAHRTGWKTRHWGCVIIVAARLGTRKGLRCSGTAYGCERGWTWLRPPHSSDPRYGEQLDCEGYDSLYTWKHGYETSIFFTDQIVDMIAYPTCGYWGCYGRNGAWVNGRSKLQIAGGCHEANYEPRCESDGASETHDKCY